MDVCVLGWSWPGDGFALLGLMRLDSSRYGEVMELCAVLGMLAGWLRGKVWGGRGRGGF